MSKFPELPLLRIGSPCHESWGKMSGSNRNRFCDSCQKNVYDFSEMTTSEVSAVLRNNESVCARMRKRDDGSIITRDTTRRGFFGRIRFVAASMTVLLTLAGCSRETIDSIFGRTSEPNPAAMGNVVIGGVTEMGEVCPPELGQASVEPQGDPVDSTETPSQEE